MFINHTNKKEEIYSNHIKFIKGITFTIREVDIISCILNNRGEKKIAYILSISPKTVNTHAHNIMLKLGCNSRDGIIDFIEKSGKVSIFKKYYTYLIIHSSFNECLSKIGKIINRKSISCFIEYNKEDKAVVLFINQLKQDLSLSNIILLDNIGKDEEVSHNLHVDFSYLLNSSSQPNQQIDNISFILEKDINLKNLSEPETIDLETNKNQYYLILDLVNHILNNTKLNSFIEEFKNDYSNIFNNMPSNEDRLVVTTNSNFEDKKNSDNTLNLKFFIFSYISKRQSLFLFIISLLCTLGAGYISYIKLFNKESIRVNLLLPNDNLLLKREDLINEIDQKFIQDTNDIKTVVIAGIGGAGKTTLARLYARKQNLDVIWEINSETNHSLIFSLIHLGYVLSSNINQKQELKLINDIQDEEEKCEKILLFLSKKFSELKNWLIIYDNVESFEMIKKYLFYDSQVWGKGKIIITTRNANIIYSNYIKDTNLISLHQLNEEEKWQLFFKNININNFLCPKEEIKNFLKQIPPFPLDISIAANHIKETKMLCTKYLEYLFAFDPNFNDVQENILANSSQYSNTRFDIVTLSLEHIIDKNPQFVKFLLLICTINSQNIPKGLLATYKGDIIADNFIHYMNKFSLISNDLDNQFISFSIHRSTQEIILEYLKTKFDLKNSNLLPLTAAALQTYMEKEFDENHDILQIKSILPHAENFLRRADIGIPEVSKADVMNELGNYYLHIYEYKKAISLLEQSVAIYKNFYGNNHKKTARAIIHLGGSYKGIEKYNKAIDLLEQGAKIYEKIDGTLQAKTAWPLVHLGNAYLNIGKYDKAEVTLNKALAIYTPAYGKESSEVAWALVNLGNLHKHKKSYTQAKKILKLAMSAYKKVSGEHSVHTAWAQAHLGSNYRYMNDYINAQKFLKQSITTYNNHNIENTHTAWINLELAKTLLSLKNYEEAKKRAEKALYIFQNYHGKDHKETEEAIMTLDCIGLQKRS